MVCWSKIVLVLNNKIQLSKSEALIGFIQQCGVPSSQGVLRSWTNRSREGEESAWRGYLRQDPSLTGRLGSTKQITSLVLIRMPRGLAEGYTPGTRFELLVSVFAEVGLSTQNFGTSFWACCLFFLTLILSFQSWNLKFL